MSSNDHNMFATPSPSNAAGGGGGGGGMFSPEVRTDLADFGSARSTNSAGSANSRNAGGTPRASGGNYQSNQNVTPYRSSGSSNDPPGSSSSSSAMPTSASSPPKPTLLTDANHTPKTHGSLGLLIVGLGGANGTTTLAGILANRHSLNWHGPQGQPMSANYNGCITQLKQRGVHGGVGYADKIRGLADASMAAVGGWDIRPTKLGDALLQHQILDYDLVAHVQREMNATKVFRGYYDPRFIGSSQHAEATYILTEAEAPNASEALKSIRADIRYFKWRNGVVGHTTVIWSASVEPNCEFCVEGGGADTAIGLLQLIEMTEEERGGPLPPSLIYATAAVLEGCSFVNGGSQNTLCGGLAELARQQRGVYCLGTDFKAGQTKFKTAAIEYIRTMGLTPKVVASSNRLGNNDMRNLASADSARMAKLRVKHDIFAPWNEDIDHKVSVMFTPMINDEKRDFVEYTSLGFLGQTHTMVTYTRASDSVLCVPLMIDAAVWCDYFSNRSWPYEDVAKALAYLFKVPEGGAKGVDPGFFKQMTELDNQALAADRASTAKKKGSGRGGRKVRIRAEEKTTEWAIPHDAGIVCAGLACVDMQLNEATGGDGGEAIETFQGEKSIGGGSVSMACKTLARLTHGEALDADYMQVTPPAINAVIPLCKIGKDNTGDKLVSLLESCGSACRNVSTKFMKSERDRDQEARTALAVLPIYQDGRRGCFFDAASNATFSPDQLIGMMSDATSGSDAGPIGAFLFGYPHLLPMMQGDALAQIFSKARALMEDGGVTALDLNGVPETDYPSRTTLRSVADLQADPVLGPALPYVDILHMNEDELVNLTGCQIEGTDASQLEDEFNIASAVSLFLMCGVAVVAVTRGKRGCFISCNDMERFEKSKALPSSWVDCTTKLEALELPPGTRINTNGAGDSFTSGLLVAALLRHTGLTIPTDRSIQSSIQGAYSDDGTPLSPTPSALSFSSPSGASQQQPALTSPSPSKNQGKMTPYRMYMKEHYVSLKAQCDDDKRAIFTKCHEMWENEPDHVKEQYARKVEEEASAAAMLEATGSDDRSAVSENDTETSFSRTFDAAAAAGAYLARHEEGGIAATPTIVPRGNSADENGELANSPNRFMANRALNLESAAQFATLVAAHHIDVSTRDNDHLDLSSLLERSMIVPDGLQEI